MRPARAPALNALRRLFPFLNFGASDVLWTRVRRGFEAGAGRGSRTPKGRSPADFEADGSSPKDELNE